MTKEEIKEPAEFWIVYELECPVCGEIHQVDSDNLGSDVICFNCEQKISTENID